MNSAPSSHWSSLAVSLVSALLLGSWLTPARADYMVAGGLEFRDIRVVKVAENLIIFEINGQERSRPLASVTKLVIDSEPSFNAAEEAYAKGQWDKATDLYDKAARSTQKEFIRSRSSARMVETATKAGRFDIVVKRFIDLAKQSPAEAATMTLTMPDAKSDYLNVAAKQLEAAIADTKDPKGREVLLKVLANVYRTKGDTKGAEEIAKRLAQIEIELNPNSPAALQAGVDLLLSGLDRSLDKKEYDAVIQTLEKEAARITEQPQQVRALLLLARAKDGKTEGKTDVAAWKDVAVAYMRVVANAPASAPEVPQALLRVAAIHRASLNDKATAGDLYRQIIAAYKDLGSAKEAQQELAKLEKEPAK